jgi:hypothetical protein
MKQRKNYPLQIYSSITANRTFYLHDFEHERQQIGRKRPDILPGITAILPT